MESSKENFQLIGIQLDKKTTNKDGQAAIDCGSLWQQFETEKRYGQIENKIGNEIYAVYFDYDGDHTQPYSYFIGCKVAEGTLVPEGFKSLKIPAQTYTQKVAKGVMPACIGEAWREIWKEDAELNRAYQYDFEVYDERCADWNNAEVDIFLSVKK
ncbi:putative transcriptional regulator YdeE [Flavobacterium sp. 28YEA47A]|uniref:GyrI-like domain-containing protein n=1 Tax=Flavobacterium sp. 28YEA47A TaxID=3156276 RepID=UPI0035153A2E